MIKDNHRTGLEIAVIGMAARFPGAKNVGQFWNNLIHGEESVTFLTDEELEQAGVKAETYQRKDYVKSCGGVLENKDSFDASFFGYTPAEAEIMNPQTRIFHECTWEALENAGYDPFRYGQRIGLFAAAGSSLDWEIITRLSGKRERLGDYASWLLDSRDFLATRVSYKMNLTGPSILLNTTCSSSLVAIDAACRSLLTGQCEIALAGGVSVSPAPKEGYIYEEGMILSPDGHCRAFDADAKGTTGGEGAGIVVLKPLEEALQDNDNVISVIKGFAVNNDGNRKIGYTAPSTIGQAEAISATISMAGIDPESITYVETHGTGTILGDPMEIKALTKAFGAKKKQFCRIGSVKTNIGHLDEAAGIAGFIKTVLALKHRTLPPSLHFNTPNPNIDFDDTPFQVNNTVSEWENTGFPLRAGVSSFGIGGTNAHVILEEAPAQPKSSADNRPQVLPLSAKTATALEQAAANLADYLKENKKIHLADIAYTLQAGRAVFEHKRWVVASNHDEAIGLLESKDASKVHTYIGADEVMPIVFMFPGQGSQYVNMGKTLYETEPAFKEEMDRCFCIMRLETDVDFMQILYPEFLTVETRSKINETQFAQPLLFTIEYSLASVLISWGIVPSAMIGHSLGEYVAACVSGVLTLEEAIRLVIKRGKLMQSMPHGSMLSIQLPESEVREMLCTEPDIHDVSIAVINSPDNCVVSGPEEAIRLLESKLTDRDYPNFRVHTSHAFHSNMMAPMIPLFAEEIKRLNMQSPTIPYLSNVSGTWIKAGEVLDQEYWCTHLLSAVRFSDGIEKLLEYDKCIFIEVGPGRSLSAFVRQQKKKTDQHRLLNIVRHPNENTPDNYHLAVQIGKLWALGVGLDWFRYHRYHDRQRIPLPSYPFEGQRYWIDIDVDQKITEQLEGHTRRVEKLDDWFYVPTWKLKRSHTCLQKDKDGISHVLLFAAENKIGDKLHRAIAKKTDVILVRPGSAFLKESSHAYTVRPQEYDDYDRLFADLKECGSLPENIIQAWDVDSCNQSSVDCLGRESDLSMLSLMRIAKTIGGQKLDDPVEIVVLTSGIHPITETENLCPERSTVLGPVRVIPLEYVNLTCRSIDVIPSISGVWDDKLIQIIINEAMSRLPEAVVAYRGYSRWVEDFEKISLAGSDEIPALLKKQGIYVITGGLGGMGLAIAEYLLKELRAKVILLGRTMEPAKLKKVEHLQALGGEVIVCKADAADFKQLNKAIDEGVQRFGEINGVFHAAGLPDGGLIQFRADEETERVLAPKILGTQNIYRIFQDKGLDFLLLCSSLSSILAPIGQAAYCAANSFLDSFATSHVSDESMHIISVNWDTWRDTGMAFEAEKKEKKLGGETTDFILEGGLLASEGVEVLKRILHSKLPQVIISTADLDGRMKANEKDSMLTRLLDSQVQSGQSYENRSHPEYDLEEAILKIWCEHLGYEQIGIHDNFFDLGASSLDLIQVRLKIIEKLNIGIGIVDIYTHTTISSLCKFLTGRQEVEIKQEEVVTAGQIGERGKNRLQQRKRQIRGGN